MSSRSFVGGKDRLALEALNLKKAWILAVGIVGKSALDGQIGREELKIPAYHSWTRKRLQSHTPLLRSEYICLCEIIVFVRTRKQQDRAISWMAKQFDRWVAAGMGIFPLCTVQEFESQVGRLLERNIKDIPPYTELLLQGLEGLALRHPEYMLSRDLQLLCNLSRDAEQLTSSADLNRRPSWLPYACENAISLNRAAIVACFNLLESFTSGLARTYVMEHPDLDASQAKKLLANQGPLRERLLFVARFVTGDNSVMGSDSPPFSDLFGDIQRRRNAFVHCEPGPQQSSKGYIKEAAFHDVSWPIVKECVASTLETIRRIWRPLTGKDQPSWLPVPDKDGRFPIWNLRLNPAFPTSTSKGSK